MRGISSSRCIAALKCWPVDTPSLRQLLTGLSGMPIPIDDAALVISDNADIYGTVEDLWRRAAGSDDIQ